jgi:hypothetical protein
MSALEPKLRRLVASLDTTALEALANKGLLRRARKDVERGIETRICGETDTSLRIRIGDFEVTLPESGPATAGCSCPAAGVCQHILTAVLFLQRETPEAIPAQATAPSASSPAATLPSSELMAITPEQLEKWAGKPSFRAGLKLVCQFTPEIIAEKAIRIRFPLINLEVHFIPGGGLDGMIASGGKGDSRQFIVAAVVGFQRANGTQWDIVAEAAPLAASEGAPRSRSEVLDSCQLLLTETLNNGLSRISNANQQRWATLAVSALGVNLPRLALLLRGIGDEAAIVLARDARSDLGRMLDRMAQTHALCSALEAGGDSPRTDLVGLHRTRYDEVGHLDLVGAAAWPWRTASGYEGLTVLFWDPSGKRWNSWTESRPRHQLADFKPVARYTQPGPWEGAESPRQLARRSFRLMNARRNPSQRLSGSGKSRVLVTGSGDLHSQNLDIIDDWERVSGISNALLKVGLREPNPLDSVVVVKPVAWGDRGFDPVTQVFTWVLADLYERPLFLEIAFDEFTEPAMKFLESVSPTSIEGALLVGRIQRTARGLSLHPYALHTRKADVMNLYLDNVAKTNGSPSQAQDVEDEGFESEEESEPVAAFSSALNRVLDEVDDALLALGEAGLASSNPLRVERLRQVVPRAERLGLRAMKVGLENIANHPHAALVLRAAYLCRLHRRAMPVSI